MKKELKVKNGYENLRLDLFLAMNLDEVSRSYIKKQIEGNRVYVNGEVEYRANYKTKIDDVVTIHIEESETQINAKPEEIEIDVVFENDDIIAVNKPIDMVVHPATGNSTGTLVNALLYKYKGLEDVGNTFRAGLINRIDKDTSGLVLVGKHNKALWFFTRQFAQREVEKKYLAVVSGNFSKLLKGRDYFSIRTYIDRNPVKRKKYSVVEEGRGRIAITKFSLLALSEDGKYSLIEVSPKTGRTHQIRVHLSHLGFPIVGDKIYNGEKYDRLMLHSWKVALRGLDGTQIAAVASIDNDFRKLLRSKFDYDKLANFEITKRSQKVQE